MIYSEAERKEIERVYGVFKDYIHASKFLDFVWSEKLGYLLLHIDPTKNTIEEDQIIASADELCAELFNEVATDVFQEAKREHFYPDADDDEIAEIEEEEMLDLTAIAQSSPGSIAINASILVGYHVAGIPGALITVVGSALPPLIIISIISAFYQAFRSNKYVSMAMAGMLAGVAAVIFDVVINMAWPILKKKRLLPIAVMLAAFVATRFFSVNIILIILVCGVIGALDTLYLQKKEAEE